MKSPDARTILGASRLLRTLCLFAVFSTLSLFTFPQWVQATIYQPGETLEPDCAPESINCGVATTTLGQFVPSAFPDWSEALLFYSSDDKSLSYYNDEEDIHVNISEDIFVRVKNETGSTITLGQLVYVSGSDGVSPTIDLADASMHGPSHVLGMARHNIEDGTYGYIQTQGLVHGVDTSSFTEGDALYLSDSMSGAFTIAPPSAPHHSVLVGYVSKSGVTGEVLMEVNGPGSGTLPIGAIPFGRGVEHVSVDATNFFWDNTNKRLGIGDATPTATLSVGNGDLFQVFGASGNVTTQGDITLTTGGGSIAATGGGLSLSGAGASSLSTSAGALTFQAAGVSTISSINIGTGGAGSATPDFLALDVKSTSGDPAGGAEGYMYYNTADNKFRCYENAGWKDCDGFDTLSFQSVYNNGSTITTSAATDIALTLTSGDLTASGAGSVLFAPTGASSFTSGGALTLTGGATSTWGTSVGDLILQAGSGNVSLGSSTSLSSDVALTIIAGSDGITLQAAGAATSSLIQIGTGGAGNTTPDFLGLAVKSSSGDPAGGAEGYMYYNTADNKFRCYVGSAWVDCDTTGGTVTLQTAYNGGTSIVTSGSDIALTLTSGDLTASGAGSVLFAPTGASSFTSGGALTLTGGATSTWGTSAGALVLQAAGLGASYVQIGSGGVGSTVPDILALDVKSDAGDPIGFNGAMYYSEDTNTFRCYEDSGWKDCDTGVAAGSLTLQQAYIAGSDITTSAATDIALTLTSGDLTASGAGSVLFAPTGASSFTSGGALTLTGGATSTWGTTDGSLILQAAGAATSSLIQIGTGGAGNTTPDFLGLAVKSSSGDPAGGAEGYMYYNTADNKFRCYENAGWKDCDTAGSPTFQSVYNNGSTITTSAATDIDLTLTSGDLTVSGAGSVLFAPTGASSFTSGGALTLTGGATSTWGTSVGDLTIDAGSVLHLGTGDATSIILGQTGVVSNVGGALSVAEYVDFGTSSDPAHLEGRLFYDYDNHSLGSYIDESEITLNIGQENYTRVKNASGSTIPNGSVVYISGSDGGTAQVSLAQANVANTSQAIGIATHDIEDGTFGYVTTFGLIHDLNTASYSPGDPIYLSASVAGEFTTIRPSQPNSTVPLGYVTKQHATEGDILVMVTAPKSGAFTAGALAFGDSSGNTISDSTNLFWDNGNDRLGIGDNTPAATLTVGSGDLFEVFGATGNVTTAGDITLGTGGGTLTSSGGALTVSSASGNALNITSGTTGTLTLDSGSTGALNFGTGANAKTITIGNTTGATALSLQAGTGNIGLQVAGTDTTGTVQVGAGGAGSATPDLFVLDIKSTSGDPTGTAGAMYYNSNSGKFRCFENGAWANCVASGADVQHAASYDTNEALTNIAASQVTITSVSVTPSTATGDVYVRGKVEILSSNNTDQSLVLSIEDNATCTGSTLATNTITITSATGVIIGDFEIASIEVDAGASLQSYSLCASTATGDTDIRFYQLFATVIDTGADLAEIYTTHDESIGAGDVVAIDSTLQTGVKKSTGAGDTHVLGIVSTNPGMLIGGVTSEGTKAVPVALSGRVPVKVTNENGPIVEGDFLTPSSIAGVAMKSNGQGVVVGQAMAPYDSADVGFVLAFVRNFVMDGGSVLGGTAVLDGTSEGLAVFIGGVQSEDALDVITTVTEMVSSGKQLVANVITARVTALRGYFDELFTNKIHTEELCVKKSDGTEVCVTGDQLEDIIGEPVVGNDISTSTPIDESSGDGGDETPSDENQSGDTPGDGVDDTNPVPADVVPDGVIDGPGAIVEPTEPPSEVESESIVDVVPETAPVDGSESTQSASDEVIQ